MARLAFLLLLATTAVGAQTEPDRLGNRARVYVGGGFGPGFGGVAQVSDPVLSVLTREAVFYADYVPRVFEGSGRLVTALGVGGSLRVLRVADVVRNRAPGPRDLDLGIRIGPSFYTAFFEETAESRSRAFSVMLDPFARATLRRGPGLVLFAEVGSQSPSLRAGLATSIQLPEAR